MGLRARAVGAVVALACVAVAGCGSSGRPPSALDPARVVPANAIVYAEATVRPQGAQRDEVESALRKLLGHSPDGDIQRGIHLPGLSYKRDIQPWLGQRIGFVATAFSLPGIAVIAPTNDPAAALTAIARGERSRGRQLTAGKYGGVAYQQFDDRGVPVAFGAVGHYAVIGGTTAFMKIVDTYQRRSPALQPTGSNALAQAYVNARRALAAVMAIPTISPAVREQLGSAFARAHVPASLTLSLSVSPDTFTADLHSSGAPRSSTKGTADVSGLPGDSWLAISTGNSFAKQFATGFNAGFIQGFSRAARASGVNPNTLLQRLRQRTGIDVIRDLLPALGPFQLSVQGSSITALQAALALYPADPAAGARLISEIHNLAARSHSLRVTGGSRSFGLGPASLPFPLVAVSDLGRKIVARFSLSAQHSGQGSTLSTNPAFTRAHAQLAAGSNVPLFVNFGPLAALLSQTPQFKAGGSDHKALTVLRRLDYFVIGVSPAEHDLRVVLGVH